MYLPIELPEDIVEHIISFTIDRRGYNVYHYNRRKRINLPRMERIISEIKYNITNMFVFVFTFIFDTFNPKVPMIINNVPTAYLGVGPYKLK